MVRDSSTVPSLNCQMVPSPSSGRGASGRVNEILIVLNPFRDVRSASQLIEFQICMKRVVKEKCRNVFLKHCFIYFLSVDKFCIVHLHRYFSVIFEHIGLPLLQLCILLFIFSAHYLHKLK